VIATAAAALKAIGGWDESDPIVLRVNGRTVEVRLHFGLFRVSGGSDHGCS
jgi:hypothetical protein